jgi:hypothetical protein
MNAFGVESVQRADRFAAVFQATCFQPAIQPQPSPKGSKRYLSIPSSRFHLQPKARNIHISNGPTLRCLVFQPRLMPSKASAVTLNLSSAKSALRPQLSRSALRRRRGCLCMVRLGVHVPWSVAAALFMSISGRSYPDSWSGVGAPLPTVACGGGGGGAAPLRALSRQRRPRWWRR